LVMFQCTGIVICLMLNTQISKDCNCAGQGMFCCVNVRSQETNYLLLKGFNEQATVMR